MGIIGWNCIWQHEYKRKLENSDRARGYFSRSLVVCGPDGNSGSVTPSGTQAPTNSLLPAYLVNGFGPHIWKLASPPSGGSLSVCSRQAKGERKRRKKGTLWGKQEFLPALSPPQQTSLYFISHWPERTLPHCPAWEVGMCCSKHLLHSVMKKKGRATLGRSSAVFMQLWHWPSPLGPHDLVSLESSRPSTIQGPTASISPGVF